MPAKPAAKLSAKPAAPAVRVVTTDPADALRDRFAQARADLASGLIERETEIDLALTAMLAGENLLLIGPPGCGKSLLLDSLMGFVSDASKFSILLTKFSFPEEVMGPYSIKGLQADDFRRVTTNRLPEADVAFIDEVFKGNSAILNCLLRLLNEGVYEQSGQWVKSPLSLVVAGSNEYPSPENGGKELSAIFDRFVLRAEVQPIRTQRGLDRLFDFDNANPGHKPTFNSTITLAELDMCRKAVNRMPWTDGAKEALHEIDRELRKEGVIPGDRRRYKAVNVARASAWLGGSDTVKTDHLEVLSTVLWDDPKEQPRVCAKVIGRVANPVGMKVNGFRMEVETILSGVDPSDLASSSMASAKLTEVIRQLKDFESDTRGAAALREAQEALVDLKRKSLQFI